MAWNPDGSLWLSAEGSGLALIYAEGAKDQRPPVTIPSGNNARGGKPTGVVLNTSNGFPLPQPNGQSARFIFAGDDGVISAWNGQAGNNAMVVLNNTGASYTGLTMATYNGAPYLYAADFKSGRIDVFDDKFQKASIQFQDGNLPAGYAPFNIQEIDGNLFVTYAKVGGNGDEQAGMGLGYVDMYSPSGLLERRFVSSGNLNAPWGISKAPATFFAGVSAAAQGVILVGNFGDGHINAYGMDGTFLGELSANNKPVVIEGLWALSMAPAGVPNLQDRLYFTAGPDAEQHGLFGYLKVGNNQNTGLTSMQAAPGINNVK
jgi:uncharacterized protein (TIGR03118 family)